MKAITVEWKSDLNMAKLKGERTQSEGVLQDSKRKHWKMIERRKKSK